MAIKNAGYDGEPGVSKRLWGSNWNKDHMQMDFDHTIASNDNGGYEGWFGEENEGVLWKGSRKLQIVFGA